MTRIYIFKRARGKCPKGFRKRCARGNKLQRTCMGRCQKGWRKRCVRAR